MKSHLESIINQFTLQAPHFAEMPGHNDEESLTLIVDLSGVSSADTVLDVACGSGIVACAFAAIATHVTGVDITPAMLDEARANAARLNLKNLSWQQGDVEDLPFEDNAFSIVVSRFAFHHVLDPARVLQEMVRVCRRDGRVVVVDAILPESQVDAYNHFEKLLDTSHSRALSFRELHSLTGDAGLQDVQLAHYRMEAQLERQIASSHTKPDDAESVRQVVSEDIGIDRLGIGAHWRGDQIHFAYPVTIAVGHKNRLTG